MYLKDKETKKEGYVSLFLYIPSCFLFISTNFPPPPPLPHAPPCRYYSYLLTISLIQDIPLFSSPIRILLSSTIKKRERKKKGKKRKRRGKASNEAGKVIIKEKRGVFEIREIT
jgi:hypothetical protein